MGKLPSLLEAKWKDTHKKSSNEIFAANLPGKGMGKGKKPKQKQVAAASFFANAEV